MRFIRWMTSPSGLPQKLLPFFMTDPARLRQLIQEVLPELIEIRQDLHRNPGLSYQETYASARVREELTKASVPFLAGLAKGPKSDVGTGVVAWLPGAAEEAVGLRADMDALPIKEETGCAHASVVPGVMHACGHDGHTAILIGAAKVLARISKEIEIPQPVRFIFQPAEEGGAGAARMVADGCLDPMPAAPRVGRMFGLHGWPSAPLGEILTCAGPITAATACFEVTVTGRGGHAAFPQFNQDPIVAASAIVGAVQSIVARNVDPIASGVISVTQFLAGDGAHNVIPSAATLRGTIRALDSGVMEVLKRRFTEVVSRTADAYGCTAEAIYEIEGLAEYPVTVNSSEAVDVLKTVLPKLRTDLKPVMGGEDFAFYSNRVPSAFFVIGLRPPERDSIPGLHHPRFDFNDDALRIGVEAFCRVALGLTGD
ncbi:MAG: amidohydrolase [Verrucomicrobiaceae bacterium]|nr:MAG: amidohydrolase [Verrucomicrobiaceae bacterium]